MLRTLHYEGKELCYHTIYIQATYELPVRAFRSLFGVVCIYIYIYGVCSLRSQDRLFVLGSPTAFVATLLTEEQCILMMVQNPVKRFLHIPTYFFESVQNSYNTNTIPYLNSRD